MPPRRADIPALVRRLTGGSEADQALAAKLLFSTRHHSADSSKDAIAAYIAAADGSIPALLRLIGSSHHVHPGAQHAGALLA